MRRNLRSSSFKLWRKRVSNRKTKHRINHDKNLYRFKSKKSKITFSHYLLSNDNISSLAKIMKNGIHDIIIIGGGLSGSYLAFKLKEKFQDLLIVEKSKVLGGRLCTKPVGSGMADYGCQYISPKSEELISLVSLLEKKSLLKKIKISPKKHVYISPHGMNKILEYLSLGVPSIINSSVNKITRKMVSGR